jgi:hypothetical protein
MDGGLIDGVSMIQSNFGTLGNLEIVATDLGGFRLMHFWRDSGPFFDWHGPLDIAKEHRSSVYSGNPAMIQTTFGDRGNLEMVARSDDKLAFFWRDADLESKWNGPEIIAKGVTGTPALIQSTFGN